jgi:hypothetical protein
MQGCVLAAKIINHQSSTHDFAHVLASMQEHETSMKEPLQKRRSAEAQKRRSVAVISFCMEELGGTPGNTTVGVAS